MKSILAALLFVGLVSSHTPARQSEIAKNDQVQTSKEFAPGSIRVEGEVESPLTVDLKQLPIRSVSVREVEIDPEGKTRFAGAYSYSGYSLCDILSQVKIDKKNKKEFKPLLDVYFVVSNDKGDYAVFSWGEVFYSRDPYRTLVSRTVSSINPSKLKTQWKLPEVPRLISADDLTNSRYVDNPSTITVRSFAGAISSGSKDDIYSPSITVTSEKSTTTFEQIDPSIHSRKFTYSGYGHGMGNKGVSTIEGYPLREVSPMEAGAKSLRTGIAVVSARDGYRVVFSVSELWGRNDMNDALLVDRKDTKSDGRYLLFVPSDFFVDRDVKAVNRIEIVDVR